MTKYLPQWADWHMMNYYKNFLSVIISFTLNRTLYIIIYYVCVRRIREQQLMA